MSSTIKRARSAETRELWDEPQLYLQFLYEAKDEKTGKTLIAMQPLVANQAYMPQMKAMCVPFHMVYGGFMCCQRLQNDRPIC